MKTNWVFLNYLFEPETVLELKGNLLQISSQTTNTQAIFQGISDLNFTIASAVGANKQVQMRARMSKEQYLAKIRSIQDHILKGDCYDSIFVRSFLQSSQC